MNFCHKNEIKLLCLGNLSLTIKPAHVGAPLLQTLVVVDFVVLIASVLMILLVHYLTDTGAAT